MSNIYTMSDKKTTKECQLRAGEYRYRLFSAGQLHGYRSIERTCGNYRYGQDDEADR